MNLFRSCLLLALSGLALSASAGTTYENYTFGSFVGPSESGSGWHDGPGSQARFNLPFGLNVDTAGNLIVADTANNTIRKVAPDGTATTIAGLAGISGSTNGIGANARFYTPSCAGADSAGNIYVADGANHTIRKITPDGVVTTFAGSVGSAGTSDGTGSAARFNSPGGVAVTSNGVVFVADSNNHTIRRISPAAVVTTLAGVGGVPGSNDGTGSGARFFYPQSLTIGQNGTLYVADTANETIRKVTTAGVVTTLAGSPGVIGSANGTGSAASFYYPCGIAAGTNGLVFVVDTYNQTVRKITSAGVVSTFAGTAGSPGSTDGTNATARFNYPFGIAATANGLVYVADSYNNTIRKITPTRVVTTLSGVAVVQGTNDGTGVAARFAFPSCISLGYTGEVYVADYVNNTIRKVTPSGDVTTIAGTGGQSGTNDGVGADARFTNPAAVAAGPDGNLYVADTVNHLIRKISPLGEVTTFAGKPRTPGTNDGTGFAARFNNPSGVAVDAQTNVYVGDTYNHTIRKISPSGEVTTIAGFPGQYGFVNGTNRSARFTYPIGVAVDTNGTVYVADEGNSVVRKVTSARVVSTLAGNGVMGSNDGTNKGAQFKAPFSLSLDPVGNVLVADTYNHTIRKVTPDGVTTTLGGTPGTAHSVDGTGSGAGFNYPESVVVDANGVLYVADSSSHALRKGNVALSDTAVATPAFANPGILRQLDVSNVTTTGWAWSLIRKPANSSADVSLINVQNPTVTPDVADLYMARVESTDSLGRAAISTVSFGTDTNNPKLKITKPVANQRWSNSVFTVTGTASDNFSIASVWCQANSNDWVKASGSIAWSAPLDLAPGTNIIRAYALDNAANSSPTSSVSMVYVPFDHLQVQAVGQGTISPNLSNRLLQVGRTLSVTASGTNGHKFANWMVSTNWIGGTVTTNPTLTFTMQSNLTLQVTFIDVGRPTVSITYPTASQRVTNVDGQVTIKGKASDNAQVGNVHYQLNNDAWTDASTTNGWKNWTAVINPLPETNVIRAYAADVTGNLSLTNSISFVYVITSPLTLVTNGIGKINRTFTGNMLEVGRSYTVTAVPGSGQILSNWTDGNYVLTTSNALTFVMHSNLTLYANFVANPFLAAQGTYNGLFGDTNRNHQSSGFFTMTLGDHGAYSASLKRGTNSYPLSGQFDASGLASKNVTIGVDKSSVTLALDFADHLTGSVSNSSWIAPLRANRAVFAATNPASQYQGKYTLVIPGNPDPSVSPGGDGFAAITIAANGSASALGGFADGNALSQSVGLSRGGEWAFYQSLYAGNGSAWAWLTVDTNQTAAPISGVFSWIKPAVVGSKLYPGGFTQEVGVASSSYVRPVNAPVFNWTNGVVSFDGGNLSSPFTNEVVLTTANKVINGSANALNLSIVLSNGTFSGSVTVPGTTRTNTYKGALLQNINSGSGYFLGTNQSGRVYIGPEP